MTAQRTAEVEVAPTLLPQVSVRRWVRYCRKRIVLGVPTQNDPAVDSQKDPRVDAYLDGLPPWQRALGQRVRDLVHGADPEVTETIGAPCGRTSCSTATLRLARREGDLNVLVYDGGLAPDPHGIITAGHDNQTARTVGLREGESVNDAALTECSARSSP